MAVGDLSKHRAAAAAKWIDKEIRKLITAIIQFGKCEGGQHSIKFGPLFIATENTMEALAGTCRAAKRHGVVDYTSTSGSLFQRYDDEVVITLLKTEIPDSDLSTYTYANVRQIATAPGPSSSAI